MGAQVPAEFADVLIPAVQPCEHNGWCSSLPKGVNTCCSSKGHVPRGFGGATELSAIELVLITAEPADPATCEQKAYTRTAQEILERQVDNFRKFMREGGAQRDGARSPFHLRLSEVLKMCWGEIEPYLDGQLNKTWYTNTVLCSAKNSGGSIDKKVSELCIDKYLVKQLERLRGQAFIIILGGKARKRLKGKIKSPHFDKGHHPCARPRDYTAAKQSWKDAGVSFQKWYNEKGR
jgi:hypothetical protein